MWTFVFSSVLSLHIMQSSAENCSCADITSALRTVVQRLDGVEKKLDTLIDQQAHGNEYFDIMNTGKKEWRLAFRGTPYINQSVYEAYKSGKDIPCNVEPGCQQLDDTLPCRNHYRNNDVLDNWANIDKVALVLYAGNTQVKHLIFDGQGSTYMDWLSQARLELSPWTDVKTETTTNFFSIEGDNILVRRFLINRSYGGCPHDYGWIVAQDRAPAYCQRWWESSPSFPVFKYSNGDTYTNWHTGNVGTASIMAILVKYTEIVG